MRRVLFGFQRVILRGLAVPGFALLFGIGGAIAQSGDLRAQDQQTKPAATNPANAAAEAAKDSKRKTDEFVEAAHAINGPAGNPECVWLGRRVVVLMWRDDLDTAFRHLDLYDRFGCPGGHVQATFRCLVRFGPIDPKAPDALSSRVHTCWINPNAQPSQPAAAAASPPASGTAAPAPAATPPAQAAPAAPAPAK
jgi:cell division septation protein DedD